MTARFGTPLVCLTGCPPSVRHALSIDGLIAVEVEGDAIGRRLAGTGARVVVAGPQADVGDVIGAARAAVPGAVVVAWSPGADSAAVRRMFLAGAQDVVLDPEPGALATTLVPLVCGATRVEDFAGILGRNPAFVAVLATAMRVATTQATVLLLGETGTGKEGVARAIHARSGRPGRFVAVNCGAIPETLMESELFGHVRGAFSGAVSEKAGLFRHADGGTLLLDEVGSLPPASQASLLRVLQEGRVRPVGGSDELPVLVRVVAATSEPLDQAMRDGRFRADLFYRLDVIRLLVPPLRERREDIPLLFDAFCAEQAVLHRVPCPQVRAGFLEELRAHDWPGNVRELKNLAERAVLTHPGAWLEAHHARALLLPTVAADDRRGRAPASIGIEVDIGLPLTDFLAPRVSELERRYLEEALRLNDGRMQATAETSGLSRRTLLRKLQVLGLDRRRHTPLPDKSPSPRRGDRYRR